jgi:hypothetical protein
MALCDASFTPIALDFQQKSAAPIPFDQAMRKQPAAKRAG